ncbi:MAG TPA: PQQ-binding-like beta-propeller repeat protein [Casimicrobiaceae bacterium]|nr:PQQ-binding-like beta-propeller repeat protein [Casimicrobiaceae bacterium]
MLLLSPSAVTAYDWLQFNGDPAHSGNNTRETTIDRGNAASLALKFQVSLPAVADGAPVLLQSVATASGVRDLLFVTTKTGHIVALDAQIGTQVWSRQYAAGACRINNGGAPCYTTSSPAIDPNRLYVYSYGLDGYVHKYQVGDGTEVTMGGWPQLATAKGFDEKGSSALAIATSQGSTYLYAVHGGYPGDNGDYQGHVTAIDLATGLQRVFNAMCSDQALHFARAPAAPGCGAARSAIWARPGVVYAAGTDRIYLATGNGSFNADAGGNNWSETVFALHPDGSGSGGKPLDSYTPANFQSLDNADADLGSTAPAILPVPASASVQHLALQTGKDGKLRLLDLSNLNGQGGPGRTSGEIGPVSNVPQGGGVLPQPAVWVNPVDGSTWVFVANGSGIAGLKLVIGAGGAPSLLEQWHNTRGGSSALVANNVLYHAGPNVLNALDPATGSVLWTTAQIGGVHWESPIVANGIVYMTDESGRLTAFALPATALKVAVIEFYNAALDHYFISSLQPDIQALDTGVFPGWARTGNTLAAYSQSVSGANPVCRFYLPPPYGDSHFYSASPAECAAVQARYPFFTFESPAVFYIFLPDPITGACPAGTQPVYRVWNNRADTNHRYIIRRATRDQMVVAGWFAEGYGNDAVIMCAPE